VQVERGGPAVEIEAQVGRRQRNGVPPAADLQGVTGAAARPGPTRRPLSPLHGRKASTREERGLTPVVMATPIAGLDAVGREATPVGRPSDTFSDTRSHAAPDRPRRFPAEQRLLSFTYRKLSPSLELHSLNLIRLDLCSRCILSQRDSAPKLLDSGTSKVPVEGHR
jgi:hypothetical protein